MELSDFYDWIQAAEVLSINDRLVLINSIMTATTASGNQRAVELRRLKAEQLMALGENVYKPDEDLIEHTRKMDLRLKKAW